ncbi:O-methyltransferase [Merdibacter massiliensis]|uniref:O-methyltransferase n=1 Tax=Merdibacter massiliensis TaxID=1871030 RepID=UPI00096A9185|nr:O-methyltransferase [Merdibacter massiliensis]
MDLIQKMEAYAKEHHVPIMEKDGIEFLLRFIDEQNCKNILEIGSAIGYSAIRMAMLADDIHVDTIERDEERYHLAKQNIQEAKLENQINIQLADALEASVSGRYDLIFIDAAKAQYIRFFERYEPYLQTGGYILSDNLGFHGMVSGEVIPKSRATRALVRKIKLYIDYLKENKKYETQFYEIGDGIAVSKKR